MEGWSGFSDEDLRRLKQSSTDNPRQPKDKSLLRDSSRTGPVRSVQPRKPNPKAVSTKRSIEGSGETLSSDQRLSSPTVTAAHTEDALYRDLAKDSGQQKKTTVSAESNKQRQESTGTGVANITKDSNHNEKVQSDQNNLMKGNEGGDLILDEDIILKHEIADLEKFREHQKMIEEQNKKKKEMLAAAIQQRQKKATAEAAKLIVIKKELDRLDMMVNADVSVIRNKIEEISREFLEAQKRYDRAEKEFVEAKIDLHKKSLQKEQLTEHLYTVIHQNEQRKAKKLSELMNKLEMEGIDEDLTVDDSQSPPVPICHISTTETRKGCLQSLGLSLITSSAAVVSSGSETTKDETAASELSSKNPTSSTDSNELQTNLQSHTDTPEQSENSTKDSITTQPVTEPSVINITAGTVLQTPENIQTNLTDTSGNLGNSPEITSSK